MHKIAFLNGRYRALSQLGVSPMDRAFLFGDAVYEVFPLYRGRLLDAEAHFRRLERSCSKLHLVVPWTRVVLGLRLREVIRRNRAHSGLVYLQISRGMTPHREQSLPEGVSPSLFIFCRPVSFAFPDDSALRIALEPDQRWAGVSIKTTNLLPNCLAKAEAQRRGFDDVWLVHRDGFITEGSSSNAWIVTAGGVLKTHPLTEAILHGVTRARVFALAQSTGLKVHETSFTRQEALTCREAFVTSSGVFIRPVCQIETYRVPHRAAQSLTRRLMAEFVRTLASQEKNSAREDSAREAAARPSEGRSVNP